MRWLRLDDLKNKTGLSKSSLYRLMETQGFPRPVSPAGCGFAVWVEAEVDKWMSKQVNNARGLVDPSEVPQAAA